MDLATVTAIQRELERELVDGRLGKIFQLSKTDLAIDFRLNGSNYLFISVQPGRPRTYLISRRLRDLEKASINPSSFALVLRKRLSGARVSAIYQLDGERVLLIDLDADDEVDGRHRYTIAIQLTGASANIFLLDSAGSIVETLRQTRGSGQQVGERYSPPERRSSTPPAADSGAVEHRNLSKRLDAEDRGLSETERFRSIASSARGRLKREISKRRKLIERLHDDLANHGDAERWKRFGDLLLANVATARRVGGSGSVIVTDYFDASAPEIAIEIDETDSLTEAAEKYFRRYTKARNAGTEIATRLEQVQKELEHLETEAERLESAITNEDEAAVTRFAGASADSRTAKQKKVETLSGVRTFVSSDKIEILVGKKAKDNDFLTFRVAKSLDTWMHAADYPGSHVVVRNPNRKEIPQRTLLEAAQLAAFYSQGKSQPKAAVHYTQKKFVNKPKGAAPGLVSLASFKTLLVEPKIGEAKLKTD